MRQAPSVNVETELTERIIGVRCSGDERVTFAWFDGESINTGDRVLVQLDRSTRPGRVVIAPGQLIEDQGTPPTARAELDLNPIEMPSGEAVLLLESLKLPRE